MGEAVLLLLLLLLLLLEGRVSMGIPMFSHVMIYEKLAVCQRVGLNSDVLRLRPTPRVLGDSLDKHILCNDIWNPAATSLYAA